MVALDNKAPVSYTMIENILNAVSDFGDFPGAFEIRRRRAKIDDSDHGRKEGKTRGLRPQSEDNCHLNVGLPN
jgi:hypothetical protein